MTKIKDKYDCALLLTHNIIGCKWKMMILWHIANGDNRFSILKKKISDITEKVLYTNLRELEECGIIYKESIYHEERTAVFYYLEEEYRNLESVINSLYEFTKYYARLNEIEIG